jgi:hypothetical protein
MTSEAESVNSASEIDAADLGDIAHVHDGVAEEHREHRRAQAAEPHRDRHGAVERDVGHSVAEPGIEEPAHEKRG